MSDDEVVLLTEDGRCRGVAPKSVVHHAGTPLHLAFSFYGFARTGQLLVTRRASAKRTWPGVWTNTCCGHPRPGEELEAAVRRRVHEELGVDVVRLWLALPTFEYRATMDDGTVENEVCPVFVGVVDGHATPDEDEVDLVLRLSWDRFCYLVEAESHRFSPWTRMQVPLLQKSGFVELASSWPDVLGGGA